MEELRKRPVLRCDSHRPASNSGVPSEHPNKLVRPVKICTRLACSQKQLGFTITEVIVVLAIVATLATLLFPTYIRGKKQAYGAVARANVRQLFVAGEIYRGEYDLSEFPHTSQFAYSLTFRPLLSHRYDSYRIGIANAYRAWVKESFPDANRKYVWPITDFQDSVIHFRDVYGYEATPWEPGDPNTVVLVLHQSFEPSRCAPSPFGVWGSHLRVTDAGTISNHFTDFPAKLTPDNTQRIDCDPGNWFK